VVTRPSRNGGIAWEWTEKWDPAYIIIFWHWTPLRVIGLSKQLAKIHNTSLNTTHSARNLGFTFDENRTFSDEIYLYPNLAITISVSFAVSVYTSIRKQHSPSPLPVFTPSLTTAPTVFTATSWSLKSPASPRFWNQLPASLRQPHTNLSNSDLPSYEW